MQITQDEFSLLKELAAEHKYPELDPQKHVTAKMLAKETGLDERTCHDILKKKIEQGELQREWVRLDSGKTCYAYYQA